MIKFADPSAQYLAHKSEIDSAINRVLKGEIYILGEEVSQLEEEFAEYIGTSYSVGVANGTDAIELALRSLDIGQGDEVITVSHTAVATVSAIEASGATPILVDVNPKSYTLDPSYLNEVLTPLTKAVIPVHLYGASSDLDSINQFCKEEGLFLIEDVSQAHGAKLNGNRLGSIGDLGCFSCFPTKNLGAIGDAGMITTNSKSLKEKLLMLREYGWNKRVSEIPGRNSRLDEIQAGILRVKLKYLDESNNKRKEIADYYSNNLSSNIMLPNNHDDNVFHLFVVQVDERDAILESLRNKNIFAGVHYHQGVHQQPAYLGRIKTSKIMTETEKLTKHIISLPIYPELPISKVKLVTDTLNQLVEP